MADVEALLEEAPWLARLARGLLGDGAAAEDLSQDVLAAALSERVAFSGARLRGWLRTVARRMAGRSLARERSRRGVEERAARSEVEHVEHGASERVDVHRRLASALERLPAIYRTALVLRYFEELPTRAVAERLGIPGATVRKRLSRGLALLRAELDAEYGDRRPWVLALGACLAEREAAPTGPTAEIGASETTVLAMSIVKLALLVIVPGGVLGLWWWKAAGGAAAGLPASPVARAGEIASPSDTHEARPEGAGEPVRQAIEASEEVSVEEAPDAAPRLWIVDAAGEPIPGAMAASIDPRGFVRAIELDDAASAELLEDLRGARFATSTPGFEPALSEPWSAGELEVALAPLREIRGIVLEDGGPPSRPVEMTCWLPDPPWSLGVNARQVERELTDLGILPGSQRVRTDGDGAFRLDVPAHASSAILILPSSHAVNPIGALPLSSSLETEHWRAKVRLDGGDLLIETTLLPTVSGRLVWPDGGEPASTPMEYWFEDAFAGNGTHYGLPVDSDGFFRIGIPGDRESHVLHPHLPGSIAKTLHVSASGKGFRDVYRVLEIDAIGLPHDLGVIEIVRAQALELRVADPSGAPIEGAMAWTQEGSAPTGRDGAVRLEFEVGGELLVLAPGYSLASLTLEVEPDSPVEVTLEPGLALEVLASGVDGARLDAGVRLKIAWDRTPFEGAEPGEGPRPFGVHYAYEQMQGSGALLGAVGGGNYLEPGLPGYQYIGLPPDGRLVIPGLQMRGECRLSLLDSFERALVERVVLLRDTPGIQRVELEALPAGSARVLVTVQGAPLDKGSLLISATGGGNGSSFAIWEGNAEIGPMLAGTYDIEVRRPGFPSHRVEACELVPGAPPLMIDLAH